MSTVYFIQSDNGLVKIGKVNELSGLPNRIRALQLGNALPVKVLGIVPDCSLNFETLLHKTFSELRQHGEWFTPSPELLTFIKENTTPIDAIKQENSSDRDPLAQLISERIARARKANRLTQGEVAADLGIGRAAYANIETARCAVAVSHLIKLARLFNQPIEYFFGEGELIGLSRDEEKLLELYRGLKPEAQQVAQDIIHSLSSKFSE